MGTGKNDGVTKSGMAANLENTLDMCYCLQVTGEKIWGGQ